MVEISRAQAPTPMLQQRGRSLLELEPPPLGLNAGFGRPPLLGHQRLLGCILRRAWQFARTLPGDLAGLERSRITRTIVDIKRQVSLQFRRYRRVPELDPRWQVGGVLHDAPLGVLADAVVRG